jgi:hypothetical protein
MNTKGNRKKSREKNALAHLSSEARRFYEKIVDGWELGADGLAILLVAAESLDRLRDAQREVATRGLLVSTAKGGAKMNPAASIERASRLAFLGALRQLNLDGLGANVPAVR